METWTVPGSQHGASALTGEGKSTEASDSSSNNFTHKYLYITATNVTIGTTGLCDQDIGSNFKSFLADASASTKCATCKLRSTLGYAKVPLVLVST